ncbi:hypothetical protein BS47DRAFT_1343619 [Hydnum rufescens UP504]|uniref:Uncharacterized protein n=1 Tax=Hydnum rufescens UP504 TaxID=1448309 RepID=A0A9P6DWS3_9AGAM|nr:hypothetical protein BS47DRAFT_1343619 [Hydnum rufescens UP504]
MISNVRFRTSLCAISCAKSHNLGVGPGPKRRRDQLASNSTHARLHMTSSNSPNGTRLHASPLYDGQARPIRLGDFIQCSDIPHPSQL